MKQRISALLLCGMLTVCGLDLTGCMPVEAYETEHFRFSVDKKWKLDHAYYDEESQKNKYLRFILAMQDFEIQEQPCDLPLTALTEEEETDCIIKELPDCKYPTWETIWATSHITGEDGNQLVEVTVAANGYFLTVRCWFNYVSLGHFEETLPVFLDSLEVTADPPQADTAGGSTKLRDLNVQWSDAWAEYHSDLDYYCPLTLQPANPQTDAECLTVLKLRRAEFCPMENVLARDGLNTDTFTQTAEQTDSFIPTVSGLEFIGGTRYTVTFTESGNSLVEYNYYFEKDKEIYIISLSSDGTCEDKMCELLSGFTLSV